MMFWNQERRNLSQPETHEYKNDSEGGLKPTLQVRGNCGSDVGWALAHLQSRRRQGQDDSHEGFARGSVESQEPQLLTFHRQQTFVTGNQHRRPHDGGRFGAEDVGPQFQALPFPVCEEPSLVL